jgi:Putative phage metallopeptidase
MPAVAPLVKLAIERPVPPPLGKIDLLGAFAPAPEVETFFRAAFLDPDSPLYNVEHDHLRSARIGVVWTSVTQVRQMKRVVGTVELPKAHPALSKWAKARHEFLIRQWFGPEELDFLMTLDANYWAAASDLGCCALVEHELYHCGQKRDKFGLPDFNRRTLRPKFAIKGHDAEEHTGIVRRYGAGAAAGDTAKLVRAARRRPEIGAVEFTGGCGVCLR